MEKEPILKLSLQEEKSPKVCETCKYEDYGIFEEPCRSCIIETNSNWEAKDAD